MSAKRARLLMQQYIRPSLMEPAMMQVTSADLTAGGSSDIRGTLSRHCIRSLGGSCMRLSGASRRSPAINEPNKKTERPEWHDPAGGHHAKTEASLAAPCRV